MEFTHTMAENKNISITTWYKNKDVAFAIGVDELPIGGSYDEDHNDTFYWYRKENNFWTKHWKPILDKHKWVKYSLGWIPSHTSFLGRFTYTQPTDVKQSELTWRSKVGKQWIKQVLQPIFNYGNKHYDTYVAHGYWHEVPINHYAPYWHPTSRLFKKGKPYHDKTFFDKSLQQLQQAFKYAFKHPATVFNTLPFGEGRPDIPYYFNKHGLYAFGSWLDLSKQEVS